MKDKKEEIKTDEEKQKVSIIEAEKTSDEIQISPEVIASIAGVAISSIEGVETTQGAFFDSIPDLLKSKEKVSKGIKVEIQGSRVNIFTNILVEYGLRIPDVAFEVQKKVKENVESMTGLDVKEVNVNIQGLKSAKSKKQEGGK